MSDLNYDVNKLPLGKLSKGTILRGFQALKDLSELLGDPASAQASHGMTFDDAKKALSNTFFTLIPHAFGRARPPVIQSDDMLKKEIEHLESLSDMKDASGIMKGDDKDAEKTNLLDQQFQGQLPHWKARLTFAFGTDGRVVDGVIVASVASLGVAFYFCWKLTLVLLATIPIAVLVLGLLSREIEPAIRAQHSALTAASRYVSSTLSSIDVVKVFNGLNLTLVLLATIPVAVVVLGFLSREIEPAIRAQQSALASASSYVSSTLSSIIVVVAGLGHLPWEYRAVEHLIKQSNGWRRLAVAFQRSRTAAEYAVQKIFADKLHIFFPEEERTNKMNEKGQARQDLPLTLTAIGIQLPDESSSEEEDSESDGDVTMTEEEVSSDADSDSQEEPGQVENDSLSKEYYKYRVQMLEERLADCQDRLDKKDARHAREIADIHTPRRDNTSHRLGIISTTMSLDIAMADAPEAQADATPSVWDMSKDPTTLSLAYWMRANKASRATRTLLGQRRSPGIHREPQDEGLVCFA
ncbi:NAD(+) ADP-ribosyltransferase [Apiospora sp. TS-2023a]